MKKTFINVLLCFLSFICLNGLATAAAEPASFKDKSQYSQWTSVPSINNFIAEQSQNKNSKQLFATDIKQLKKLLVSVANKNGNSIVITLPLPNGKFANFRLTPSAVMAPELAKKFPQINTFSGYQLDKPENSGRFDITDHGFHGMFSYNGKMVFIEPEQGSEHYQSYIHQAQSVTKVKNRFIQHSPKQFLTQISSTDNPVAVASKTSNAKATSSLLVYRMAVSATGEYSQFHGGTKPLVLSAIVTMVNRLNEVYQRDLAIKFELVLNSEDLIYLDAATDPFNNDDLDGDLNTAVINGIIGVNNYDIGHVVNTNGGGLAVLYSVCSSIYKGDGITGSAQPINDAFYIDYVAHEVGHQFGAEHTFNGSAGSCDGNRSSGSAYEPGSASTIMGYAGICDDQNLQFNSDPYFHVKSMDVIEQFIQTGGGSCGIAQSSTNEIPEVNAGNDYTIPAQTPFTLIGSATDSDVTDVLTYDWQQLDLGTISNSAAQQVDDGSRPLFRVWNPILEPQRTLPRLSDILANTTTKGETYPTTTRELNFRLVVRDGNSGIADDKMTINVVDTGEAFSVVTPTASTAWLNRNEIITWNSAATELPPIACTSVDIRLSLDGGENFSLTLAQQVANNGSAEVELKQMKSLDARIKISCSDNIFFAINNANFSIDTPVVPPEIISQNSISLVGDTSLELIPEMFNYEEESAENIVISSGDNYTFIDSILQPASGFVGELSVNVAGSTAGVNGAIFIASITVTEPIQPPTISGQQSLSMVEATSLTLTIGMFTYSGNTAAESLVISAGDNYTFTGTTVTAASGFVGNLQVGVTAVGQNLSSELFLASIAVTAKPVVVPTPTKSSSGGGVFWLLPLLLLRFFRYQAAKGKG